MARYRNELPQLSGDFFLTDAGLETDLIFNRGIEIRVFAAHTLLSETKGREAPADYSRGFLALAREKDAGFILDSQTWKAHMHWAEDLGATEQELAAANRDAIAFIARLREAYSGTAKPVVLNAVIGPRGDAYAPEDAIPADEAEAYHAKQIGWLAETEVDMITAMTFTQSDEAVGIVRAARAADLPVVVSFTVETDGNLPSGQSLKDAIVAVDQATETGAAYFMVNCAHPDHFTHVLEAGVLEDGNWVRRVRGIRCNASRKSHAELDESATLDDGNPVELGGQYKAIRAKLPWLNVFGACCGADLRHVTEIARALAP